MKRLTAAVCCLCLMPFAMTLQAADDAIDIDAMSVAELRDEIEKIEKEVYRVFNLRTEDDSLHVICHDYTPTGSNITREACEPSFLIEARSRNARNYQDGLDELLDTEGLLAETSDQFERFNVAMANLNADYDYFRELNIILSVLRNRMEEIR